MSQSAAAKQTQRHTFPKTIEIEITDEENTIRMKDHLDVEFKIDATKAQRAAKMAEFNADLKALRQQRAELITTIQSKKEKRDIACYLEEDFRRNMMLTKRADTGAVIDERALTLEERQESLPLKAKTPEEQEADAANDAGEAGDGAGSADSEPASGPEPERTEDADIERESAAAKGQGGASKGGSGGKVLRIKASDAKKRKASRAAKDKAGK